MDHMKKLLEDYFSWLSDMLGPIWERDIQKALEEDSEGNPVIIIGAIIGFLQG